jgi:hypothetical protein
VIEELQQIDGDLVVMHDSSEIDLHGRDEPSDAGPLRSSHARGYMLHNSTAIDPQQRLVIGIIAWTTWTRTWKLKHNDQSRPAHEKESYKWKRGLQELGTLPEPVRTRMVHVMDREGDVHENFEYARHEGLRIIVGVRSDHRIEQSDQKLRSYVQRRPVEGRRSEVIESSETGVRAEVQLTIRHATVTLIPAKKAKAHSARKPVTLNAVLVKGPNAKQQWLLLTTCPVHSVDDAWRVFDYYRMRTIGEDSYKLLKTGLLLEQESIASIEAFERKLAILVPVANLLHRIARVARSEPTAPAASYLDQDTLARVRDAAAFNQISVPKKAWTLAEAVHCIAQLGGFEPRKGRLPGWQTLWRGWRALQQFTEIYEFARDRGAVQTR